MINNVQQYDRFYTQADGHAYGEPNRIVLSIPDYLETGTVLDLGAGDGRHALFLASRGFAVTALDTSAGGLEKLKQLAQKNGLAVQTIVADLAVWSFDREYDVIIAATVLQHLMHEDALRLLQEMKGHTRLDGINAISLFTNKGDRFLLDQEADPGAFYPPEQWLKEFYQDWEVLEYSESESPLIGKIRADGTPMKNVMAKIVARKR